MWSYAIILLLASLFLFIASPAEAINVSSCITLSTSGATYELNTSIADSGNSTCMDVAASNIVFDCKGLTIDGNYTLGAYAFHPQFYNNITIKNCIFSDWGLASGGGAIRLHSVNPGLITNNTFNSNNQSVYISHTNSRNIVISNNTITFGRASIMVDFGRDNTIRSNNLTNATLYSIQTSNGANNTTITGNTIITGNIMIANSHNNTVSFNTIYANGNIGIEVPDAINTTIANNTIMNIAAGTSGAIFSNGGTTNFTRIANNTILNSANGIYLQGSQFNHTIENNNIIANRSGYGIYMQGVFNSTLSNNNISNNDPTGLGAGSNLAAVRLIDANYTTMVGNTIQYSTMGIFAITSAFANITGNNVSFNAFYGIDITSNSFNATIHSNNISKNLDGIQLNSNKGGDIRFNIITDSSDEAIAVNTNNNSVIFNNTIRNNTIGITMFSFITNVSYNDITNSSTGIWMMTRGTNNITYNNISYSGTGTKLQSANGSSIVGNTYASNTVAIKLTSASNNTIQSNTFLNNLQDIVLDPSPQNTIDGNTFRGSGVDIVDDSSNTFTNNVIFLPGNSSFLKHNRDDTGTLNNRLDFNFTVQLPNGTAIDYTINRIALYPSKPFLHHNSSGSLIGNFTPTDAGINSLYVNISVGSNIIVASYPFLIGGDIEEINTYYLRASYPTKNQPKGFDSNISLSGHSLLRNLPTADEFNIHTTTTLFTVDENPLFINNVRIIRINSSIYYSSNSGTVALGFQNIVGNDNLTVVSGTMPAASSYTQNLSSFEANWTIDTPDKWLRIGGKLIGNNVSWRTTPTQPSHINFTYRYAAQAPKVFAVSSGAKVLSSTSNSSSYVALTVDGDGPANLTVQLPSSSTYTILYDNATCSSPTCNSTQTSNNITLSLALGSVHTVEFYIPTTATTTTTTGGGGSLVDVKGQVTQPSGIPTVDEQASTTSVPPSSVPARPGEYAINEEGAVILLEGNLTEDNKTLPGTIYLVGYPQSPFIVGGIVKSDPLKYGSLPQRSGFATKSLTSYDIEIKSGVAYFCMNYRGFENPSSVTVFEFTNGAWRELPRDRFANNLTTSTACGTVKGTPYLVAGFVSAGVETPIPIAPLPIATNLPLAVYALGALAAVAYFAYRFRSGKK